MIVTVTRRPAVLPRTHYNFELNSYQYLKTTIDYLKKLKSPQSVLSLLTAICSRQNGKACSVQTDLTDPYGFDTLSAYKHHNQGGAPPEAPLGLVLRRSLPTRMQYGRPKS